MPIVTESQEHVLELISAHENNSISTPIAKADIIEIHNRPLVFTFLKENIDCKFIIYFFID